MTILASIAFARSNVTQNHHLYCFLIRFRCKLGDESNSHEDALKPIIHDDLPMTLLFLNHQNAEARSIVASLTDSSAPSTFTGTGTGQHALPVTSEVLNTLSSNGQ